MVGLVLDDAGVEVARDKIELLALAAERRDPQLFEARYPAAHVRDTQASFPIIDRSLVEHRYRRVDQERERHGRHFRVARMMLDFEHGNLERKMNLRSGKSHSAVLAHRFDHVVEEGLNLRRSNPRRVQRLSGCPNHGMAEASDLENHLGLVLVWSLYAFDSSVPNQAGELA